MISDEGVPGSNPDMIFFLLEKSVFLALKVSVAQFISAKIQLAGTWINPNGQSPKKCISAKYVDEVLIIVEAEHICS